MQTGEIIFLCLLGGYLGTVSGLIDPGAITGWFGGGDEDEEDDIAGVPAPQVSHGDFLADLAAELEPMNDPDAAAAMAKAAEDHDMFYESAALERLDVDGTAASIFGGLGSEGLLVTQDDDNMFDVEAAFAEDSGGDAGEEDDAAFDHFAMADQFDWGDADEVSEAEAETAGDEVAVIDDFDPSQEVIRLQYEAETDPETGEELIPVVAVNYDPDADVTRISLDGEEVATLDGDAGITEEDVELERVA